MNVKSLRVSILSVLAAPLALALTAVPVQAADDPIPIRLGLHAQTSWLMYTARELETFQEVGLEPRYIRFTTGAASIPAMESRSVDIASPGITPFAAGAAQGVEWRIVGIDTELPGAEGFVARRNSGIQSVEDFAGKTVGVARGSTSDYGLIAALREAGVPQDEVNILYLDPPESMAAMLNEEIDAAAIWEPWMQRLSEDANGEIIATEADYGVYTAVAVYAAHADFIEENPEAVRRFVHALKLAYDYIEENGPDIAIEAVSEAMNIPADVVGRIYEHAQAPNVYRWNDPDYLYSITPDGQFSRNAADMIEYLASQEIIPRHIDISEYFEPSFVEDVLSEHGN